MASNIKALFFAVVDHAYQNYDHHFILCDELHRMGTLFMQKI